MAVYGEKGFDRSIHNIENAPFRTKFDKDVNEMKGYMGIGCISDYEPQPSTIRIKSWRLFLKKGTRISWK